MSQPVAFDTVLAAALAGEVGDGAVCTVASRLPPAGRPFTPTAEAALQRELPRLAARFAGAGRLVLVVPECVSPCGVPDLVVVVTTGELLRGRLAAGVAPLLWPPDAHLVAALDPQHGRRLEELTAKTRLGREQTRWRVRVLVCRGAVRRTGDGKLTRHPALVPLGGLHALEAKVRNWRRWAAQTAAYQRWADTASLVLACPQRDLAALEQRPRDRRLGLATADAWQRDPVPTTHTPAQRLLASEFIAAAFLGPQRELRVTPRGRTWAPPHPGQQTLFPGGGEVNKCDR